MLKVQRRSRAFYGKANIIFLKEVTIPYSFLNYIFLNELDYREGNIKKEVLIHEYAHIRQKHTFDILFVELLKILFWFNPVFQFNKNAIQINHEFLADYIIEFRAQEDAYYGVIMDAQKLLCENIIFRINYSTVGKTLYFNRKMNRIKQD